MTYFTHIIADGLAGGKVPDGVMDFEPTRCVLSGESISRGYDLTAMLKGMSGIQVDTFGITSGFISESAAFCMANTWNLGGRVFIEGGTAYAPMISQESAEKADRPCWSKLVRELANINDKQVVIILSDDFKKRVWQRSREGYIGKHTPILFHSGDLKISTNLEIDWEKFIKYLDIIEVIYSYGFSKYHIRAGLWSNFELSKADMAMTTDYERQLSEIREEAEFLPALLIAQKTKEMSPPIKTKKEKKAKKAAVENEQIELFA